MYNFENKTFEYIHYSRFIASWNNTTKGRYDKWTDRDAFKAWLRTIKVNDKSIPEEVIYEICELKDNGKLELEESARRFQYIPE